jgi:hypothetical protein
MSFAVSVFHAYGHQWPCQLVYHPRKRQGFGLTDGEGCERFWSSIRILIPVLRVSGVSLPVAFHFADLKNLFGLKFHRRLLILDNRVEHMEKESFRTLGSWLLRRWKAMQKRRSEAQAAESASAVSVTELEGEWAAQVESQTKTNVPRTQT